MTEEIGTLEGDFTVMVRLRRSLPEEWKEGTPVPIPELSCWLRIKSLHGRPGDKPIWRAEIHPTAREAPPADSEHWGGIERDIETAPWYTTFDEAKAWLMGVVFCAECAIVLGYQPEPEEITH